MLRVLQRLSLPPVLGCTAESVRPLRFSHTLARGPAEAAAPAEQLGGSGAVLEPLLQCVAWLDAYFREPAVLEGLPVPALHHPIFQKVRHNSGDDNDDEQFGFKMLSKEITVNKVCLPKETLAAIS
ncbi:hypothetical protein E5288_WYG001149 [Bos mutus]|uniref:Uncharacterized protein n=1 Tax=Bos mutus TaxID=72004 RepID=A0A6B0S064_9CETA|nr:hypothetical protein [Bos mutus]